MKAKTVVSLGLCWMVVSCVEWEGVPLKDTFEQYAEAIQNRDLEALLQTVTESDTVHFIGTTGQLMKTRQEYYDFHAEWFEESSWDIEFQLNELYAEADLGYVMAVFTYRDTTLDDERLTVVSWVTLIFHRERGAWRMIADVCTPIRRDVLST